MLTRSSPDYPPGLAAVLKDNAPPVLFAKGNLNLLETKSVAICGSRKSSAEACHLAVTGAAELARRDIVVVSGYADGVDTAAHIGALSGGGATIFVLATGIMHFSPKSSVAGLLADENSLVLSEFTPKAGWLTHAAMQRNKTVCALANAVLIVESALTGGTFETGNTALDLGCPLFAVQHPADNPTDSGNRHFLARGAQPVGIRSDGSLDIEPLLRALEDSAELNQQTSLFE
jgi:DNA processing protein